MRVAATFSQSAASTAPLIDGIGRRISYLRLSVTDRCDLRCRYCMAEDMTFLPKSAVLSIEEMGDLAERFVARGINRIRLTGGEPLVRRGIDTLAMRLGAMIGHGLDELTLTTNAMRLAEQAPMLAAAGVTGVDPAVKLADGSAMDVWRAMIAAQGGIFGWVADTAAVIPALQQLAAPSASAV